ncbi:MAG: hypothetical protein JKX92_05455 [Porticoccaceae bacterium]|nr:hypothetical protein [Porticoccaceae bacterium]
MNKLIAIVGALFLLVGCAVGNTPFAKRMDERVGSKPSVLDPTRFGDAGDLIRANFLVSGDGFTHTSENEHGDIIQHWFYSEVLPSFRGEKEFIGKCKIFLVVDRESSIIKSWGYDEDGNPQSCRDWP